MYHVVFAGTKPFASYTTDAEAQLAKTALEDAGVQATLTVAVVIPGVDGDFAMTCDNYLKGKDAIVSEVVAILDAS